jgi:hypothetical protein
MIAHSVVPMTDSMRLKTYYSRTWQHCSKLVQHMQQTSGVARPRTKSQTGVLNRTRIFIHDVRCHQAQTGRLKRLGWHQFLL